MVEIGSLRLDDTPVNGQTERGVTSNWAYDEAASRAAADSTEATARAAADTAHAANPDAHGNDLYPWIIDIDPYMTPKSNINWNILDINSSMLHNGDKSSNATQNAEIAWDIVLAKGTWTVELLYQKDVNMGISSIQFDGVEKGTVDMYSSTTIPNTLTSITGIAVPTTAKIELKLKMATKNTNSSAYHVKLQGVRLIRTA